MLSPLYQQLQPQNSFISLVQQFKKDPLGTLSQKYNIPNGMNNPNDILQYLLNTNQVSQQQVNYVMRMHNNTQIQNLLR